MVGCKDNIRIIGEILAGNQGQPKVVDPVFRSSSGTWLLEKDSISDYLLAIQGQASLITPNLMEAALISGKPVESLQDMEKISQEIFHRYDLPCLITGGHLPHHVTDVLYDGKNLHLFKHNTSSKTVHGTGCFLSSSILCYLAEGKDLYEACKKATALTQTAIDNSIAYGKGQNLLAF
jgi:hydroxymethylpyrimidine/phosphomethylpyrimidine kinase